MPSTAEAQSPARVARLIHASLIIGQVLFAAVTFLQVRPTQTDVVPLPAFAVPGLFAVSLVACIIALLLRRSIPTRPSDVSADLYWTTAQPKAMIAWVPLEAAGLLALVVYFNSVEMAALVAAAIPLLLLIALNPWYLERR